MIKASGGIGTVTGCFKRIRQNVAKLLREEPGLAVGNQDVIANDRRQGYWLREWVAVQMAPGL